MTDTEHDRVRWQPEEVTEANGGVYDVDHLPVMAAGSSLCMMYVAETAANHSGVWLEPYCHLLRDMFGNPFRLSPKFDPSWIAWNGNTVRNLAQGTYLEHAFDRLPILADALEDAGCTDADILAHLR